MSTDDGGRILLATKIDGLHLHGTIVYDERMQRLGEYSQEWIKAYFHPLDKNRVVTLGNN
jgi:hypothetical protein